jgi:hypothetical protein
MGSPVLCVATQLRDHNACAPQLACDYRRARRKTGAERAQGVQ